MKSVLIICDYYLPGYKGGGPIRSIANLVDWLGDEFAFYILTRDRDLGDEQPYPRIRYGEWAQVGNARVRYLAPHEIGPTSLIQLLNGLNYELLYLNSFFSKLTVYILAARRLGRLRRGTLLLAPRGEFLPGALKIHSLKKPIYLRLFKLLNMAQGIHWQASTPDEVNVIRRMFPTANSISTALDLNMRAFPSVDLTRPLTDILRLVSISRIARNKGLDTALRSLVQVKSPLQFEIYGPVEDTGYWAECQRLIAALPGHIEVNYKGVLRSDHVIETFSRYHGFLFPTQGENFGHVIWEALYAGCLPIISDQTPWQNLDEQEIGWVCSLEDQACFVDAVTALSQLDAVEFERRAGLAHDFAISQAQDEAAVKANRDMLYAALGSESGKASEGA